MTKTLSGSKESMTQDAGRVAQRAYELWEAAGRPHGRDTEHWVQAEKELQDVEQRQKTRIIADSATDETERPIKRTAAAKPKVQDLVRRRPKRSTN